MERTAELCRAGRWDEAERACRQAMEADPKEPGPYRWMARVFLATQRPEGAEGFLRQAIRLGADDSAVEELADSLAAQDKLEKATRLYETRLQKEGPQEALLFKLGDVLRRQGRLEEAADAFAQAGRVAPEGPLADLGLGDLARDAGDLARAVRRYSASEAAAPHHPKPTRRLRDLLATTVPKWHFPMMNDGPRNAAYQAAIDAAVRPGMLVLDIGAGSGLLSMMAARAGADQVVACEGSPAVAEVAQRIVSDNHLDGVITIIPRRSTHLIVGEDLPRRADLLLCEIFDVSLVGEDALHTLAHARQALLRDEATTIPGAARIWAVPVESAALREQFEVGEVSGFDLSSFNRLSDPRSLQLALADIEHRPLSEPFVALDLDLSGREGLAGDRRHHLSIDRGGRLAGFVFWYDLDLGSGHSLSTAPNQASTHWRQGFVPHRGEATTLEAGGTLLVRTAFRRRLLWFEAVLG